MLITSKSFSPCHQLFLVTIIIEVNIFTVYWLLIKQIINIMDTGNLTGTYLTKSCRTS